MKKMKKTDYKMRKLKTSKKGQSELIQYTMTILLGVIILISISLLIFTLYDQAVKTDIQKSMDGIAQQTADRILKLYEVGKNSRIQPANSSVLIAYDELRLPASVSNRNYEIILVTGNPVWSDILNVTINNASAINSIVASTAKVVVRTLNDPIISVEQNIPNIEAIVQGRGTRTNDKLSYYRYNVNGTTYDKIILGDAGIFVDIKVIG